MRFNAATLILYSSVVLAQAPQSPPQLSPQAAYDQAVTPLEITHRSISNWSDTEIAALGVAVIQAKQACLDRASIPYTGDGLISYAKLCAFGQQWVTTRAAATAYIKAPDTEKSQLTQAYAYLIQAELNLTDEQAALASSLDMLRVVPYSSLTDEVITSSINYLQIAFPYDALVLQGIRQPILLRLLSASQTPLPLGTPPPVPPHTLFENALVNAALQQYINQPAAAASVITALEAATPTNLPSDEAILIANARRRYALLGTHLPPITVSAALSTPTAAARINPDFGSSTVLLLFPPWCAQCIRLSRGIAPTLMRLQQFQVHIYGLLADIPPPTFAAIPPSKTPASPRTHRPALPQVQQQTPAPADKPEPPPSAANQLRGTPTLVVDPSALTDFAASDFPFLIATDHDGIIRLLLPAAPDNTFVSGGALDQITNHIAKEWPGALHEVAQ